MDTPGFLRPYTQGSFIDTLLIPSLAMFQFGDRQNAYTEKPRKSRIELEAEFRLKSLDYK